MADTGCILLTGVSGQVGGELLPMLQALGSVCAPMRAEMDLSDAESIRTYIRRVQPRWIVNPAAYTAVDKAESDVALATAINVDAVRVMGEEAARLGVPVLHFSTDYVFDGSGTEPWEESDVTGPLGVYGQTKLEGERALAATGAVHLIFRTSWVYGAQGKNFLLTILRVARGREQMTIVGDQYGAPTWSRDLARLVSHVVTTTETRARETGTTPAEVLRPVQGVYHAAAQGETTWFGFAQDFLQIARGEFPDEVFAELRPVTTAEYPTPARRPGNSRLDCGKLQRELGFTMQPWKQSTAEVMQLWLTQQRSGSQ
jgi:dTDP-4-dehydrorhamnose reductase